MLRKRTIVAILIFFFVQFVGQEVVAVTGINLWTNFGFEIPVLLFTSALLAAWYARTRFFIPAVVAWAFLWAVIVFVLYQVAAPTGQASVLGILKFNVAGLATSLAAVVLGVFVGQAISRVRQHHNREAA